MTETRVPVVLLALLASCTGGDPTEPVAVPSPSSSRTGLTVAVSAAPLPRLSAAAGTRILLREMSGTGAGVLPAVPVERHMVLRVACIPDGVSLVVHVGATRYGLDCAQEYAFPVEALPDETRVAVRIEADPSAAWRVMLTTRPAGEQ